MLKQAHCIFTVFLLQFEYKIFTAVTLNIKYILFKVRGKWEVSIQSTFKI